ncbi:hypothetical protein [Trinickia fusca]|uniref:hypothetical protein n=1 Tax=Trinickia fusca TaxID=2419777 RepID=UPI0011C3E242|nr:hypothetical protein [Trinickia fusca]
MNFNLSHAIAKIVLIFLLGVAMHTILGRLDLPDAWRIFASVIAGIVLSDVFLDYSNNAKKK